MDTRILRLAAPLACLTLTIVSISCLVGNDRISGAKSDTTASSGGSDTSGGSETGTQAGGLGGAGGTGGAGAQGGAGGKMTGGTTTTTSSTTSSTSAGAGGSLPCGPGTFGELTDDFTGNSIDPNKWGAYPDTTKIVQSGGVVKATIAGSGSAGYYSKKAYSLAACGVSIKVSNIDQPGVTAFLQVNPQGNDAYQFDFTQTNSYLNMELKKPGQNGPPLKQISYSPTDHVFWRIRAAGGTVYFETSKDGQSWAIQTQTPASALGVPITSLIVNFGISGANTSSPVQFDDFNTSP